MLTRIRPEELVHQASKLDTTYWSSIVNKSSNIQQALTRRADKVTGGDIFQALYQWEPDLKLADDSPDHALTAWIKRTINTPAFKELRATTVGSRELSAGASVTLFRELMRSQESTFKAIQQTKHSIDQMDAMMDGAMAEQVHATIVEAQEGLAKNISEGGQDNTEIKAGFNNLLQDTNGIAGALMHTDEIIHMAQDLAAFDGGRGSSLDAGSDERILDTLDGSLLERITSQDNLRKIFQIAGRMRVILQQAKSRKPKPAPTPVSISTGNDLTNVLSSELGALGDVVTEDKFYGKYLDKSLLQYDHKARVNEGLGPFICIMDVSGSMHGQPEQIAQGLYVSLARMAIEKRRKIAFIPFASRAGGVQEITSSKELVDSITGKYSVGSGTNFQPALEAGLEYLEKQAVFKHADIILITDGDAFLSTQWVDWYTAHKHQLGFRLLGLNVRGSRWQPNQIAMFDAVAHMEGEQLSSLNWLNNFADSLV